MCGEDGHVDLCEPGPVVPFGRCPGEDLGRPIGRICGLPEIENLVRNCRGHLENLSYVKIW